MIADFKHKVISWLSDNVLQYIINLYKKTLQIAYNSFQRRTRNEDYI